MRRHLESIDPDRGAWTRLDCGHPAIWHANANDRRPSRRALTEAGVVLAAVVLQCARLLPALDERVTSVIAGTEPPPSHLHTVYGIVEITTVTALGLLGTWVAPATHREPAAPAPPVEVVA